MTTAFAPVAGQPVKTRTCRRCQGKGTIAHFLHNNFGVCLACGGNGVTPVYTAAQKAAIAQRATDYRAATLALREALKGLHHTDRGLADDAITHLREFAPDRFDKLVASVLTGNTDKVVAALLTYAVDADIYTDFAAQAAARAERN